MAKIVILGAGFAGIRVAQDLQKSLKSGNHKIVLIDKSPIHVFQGDLYEVATAYSKKITDECLTKLKDTVATPITDLIDPDRVEFIRDKILKINHRTKSVKLEGKSKSLKFDYLVVALGATPNYYSIPGLEKHSLPLKTVQDALTINCHLDQFFNKLYKKKIKQDIYLSVGGGGATGVETAGELAGSLRRLSQKYKYPKELIHIQLVEGGNTLGTLNKRGTEVILKRFHKLKVDVFLNRFITKVTKKSITLKIDEEKFQKINSDILIWTGGVQVNPVVVESFNPKDTGGAIPVNKYLQYKKNKKIFAAGDNTYFKDPKSPKTRVPMLAQLAISQGKSIARNIKAELYKKPLKPYKPQKEIYVLPIGARFTIVDLGFMILKGQIYWLLKRLVYLRYLISIMPFFKALKKWRHGTNIFVEND